MADEFRLKRWVVIRPSLISLSVDFGMIIGFLNLLAYDFMLLIAGSKVADLDFSSVSSLFFIWFSGFTNASWLTLILSAVATRLSVLICNFFATCGLSTTDTVLIVD